MNLCVMVQPLTSLLLKSLVKQEGIYFSNMLQWVQNLFMLQGRFCGRGRFIHLFVYTVALSFLNVFVFKCLGYYNFSISFITFAGFPATTLFAGTFFVTTLPAPTNEFVPIITPGRIVEFAPILANFFTVGPFKYSFALGACGCGAFVKQTFGPIQQLSSR